MPETSSIEWLSPVADQYGIVTIGRFGGWLVQISPMIFNDRLILEPENDRGFYDYGWCYPKGGAAHLAALAWDPETEGEPVGFIKAVHPRPRRAGEVAG
jgi:hypothetical protein